MEEYSQPEDLSLAGGAAQARADGRLSSDNSSDHRQVDRVTPVGSSASNNHDCGIWVPKVNSEEEFSSSPFEVDGIPQIERAASSMVLSLIDLLKTEAGIRPFLTAWMQGSPTAVGLGVMCAYFASCLLRLTAATVWPASLIASGIVVLLSVLTSPESNYNAGAWGGRWLPLLNETRKAAMNWLMGNRTQPLG